MVSSYCALGHSHRLGLLASTAVSCQTIYDQQPFFFFFFLTMESLLAWSSGRSQNLLSAKS